MNNMKDTNKLVLGVAIVFTIVSVIAVLFGGSTIVSGLCSLVAVALSLAYKYKCEKDNNLELLDFMQRTIIAKNNRINVLEDTLTDKLNEMGCKYVESTAVTPIEVAKKPRRYKSKPKTEVLA